MNDRKHKLIYDPQAEQGLYAKKRNLQSMLRKVFTYTLLTSEEFAYKKWENSPHDAGLFVVSEVKTRYWVRKIDRKLVFIISYSPGNK